MTELKKDRKLVLGAFLFTPGNHLTGWRHPRADPATDQDFQRYVELVKIAERGKFDTVFFQDTAAVAGSADEENFLSGKGASYGRVAYLSPATLIAGLAAVTSHIGLVATATTTYNEPYNIARHFATVDLISGGRAGWNLVTSQVEDEAGNFGLDAHVAHADRYERAEEFYDVVAGLWRSWAPGAFLRDKSTGQYFDPGKLSFLNHRGKYFRVRGPLNVGPSPQGRPIVSQAGSSDAGRNLAARSADMIFTAHISLDDAKAFRKDIFERARRHGRGEDDIKILPGILPVIGRTRAEATALFNELQDLLPEDAGVRGLQRLAGDVDLSLYPLDGPLPPLGVTNSALGRQKLLVDLAASGNLTLREAARYFATAGGHYVVVGTAEDVADTMEEWFLSGGADGFNVMFPYFPEPLDTFVRDVVPILQDRGLFRTDYEYATLRENLGLRSFDAG